MARTNKTPAIFANDGQLQSSIAQLTARCRFMAHAHKRSGRPPLRPAEPTFKGLCRIIVGQQLSTASADAIWKRFDTLLTPLTPQRVLSRTPSKMASAGLSKAKIAALQALATAIDDGDIDMTALAEADDTTVVEALTSIHGIGPWTANIYLVFALRRRDAFPAADLALQIATGNLMRLKERPDASGLLKIAERWRPHRAAAARLLWTDYMGQREARKPAKAAPSKPRKKR